MSSEITEEGKKIIEESIKNIIPEPSQKAIAKAMYCLSNTQIDRADLYDGKDVAEMLKAAYLVDFPPIIEKFSELFDELKKQARISSDLLSACKRAYEKLVDIERYGEHKDNPLPTMLRSAIRAAEEEK